LILFDIYDSLYDIILFFIGDAFAILIDLHYMIFNTHMIYFKLMIL